MEVSEQEIKLTTGQQRVLRLLFKFRFISAPLLAQVMDIRRVSAYQVLEYLVAKDLVTKVYNNKFRIDRKPAYYYLNKSGVTTVRKLMNVKERVVHALYKNDMASIEFIEHCHKTAQLYGTIVPCLPEAAEIFTKTEISRFTQFPKNRPDLYIRTPNGQEAIVVLVDDQPTYIIRKRLEEILAHSEDEGWEGDYPRICFVLRDDRSKSSFLHATRKKLENMGFDDMEVCILATSLPAIHDMTQIYWSNAFNPSRNVSLFE